MDVVAAEPPADWRVEVDGVDHSGRYIGVEAMGIRSIGPNATFAPMADPGDGLIDVVLIDPTRRQPLVDGIEARTFDLPAGWPTFASVAGREVRLTPPAGVSLHIDDSTFEASTSPSPPRTLRIMAAGAVHYLARP